MNTGAPSQTGCRIVMMGTGDFAVPTFQALYGARHSIAALVTQPERPGPGQRATEFSRIKTVAVEHGTPVFQPENVNTPAALATLRDCAPDVLLVAAYGQILSPELLSLPRVAAINIHGSLLPKYRGAAPVAYAIWKGEVETGVSIIQVLPAVDAGPIIGMARTPIGERETAGELEERLAQLAVVPALEAIDQLLAGTAQAIPQESQLVTKAPKLKKPQGAIDWSAPSRQVDRHIRAMQPWPNAFTHAQAAGRKPVRLTILEVASVTEAPIVQSAGTPGVVLQADKHALVVRTGDGAVSLFRVQPDGRRPMTGPEFLRGYPLQPGDRLGPG